MITPNIPELEKISYGLRGSLYIDDGDTDPYTNATGWVAITALSDTVVTSLTAEIGFTGFAPNMPIPAGVTIYGLFTAIELASGDVVAYNA